MKSLFHRQLFTAIGTIFVMVVLVAILGRFLSVLRAREARVLEIRDRLASFDQNRKIFEEETRELERIRDRTLLLEREILTKETIPSLLSRFEAIADQQKIEFTLTAATQKEGGDDGSASTLEIDFSATGTLSNIQSFVQALLSEPYQLRFDRFSLYATAADSSKGVSGWQLLAGVTIMSF